MHEPPPTRADMRRHLAEELAAIGDDQRRKRPVIDSGGGRIVILPVAGKRRRLVNWASNDYLGALGQRKVANGAMKAIRRYGAGAGAARLLAGGLRCHRRLEERLASYLGVEDALVTSSGYQANIAAVTTLVGPPEDAIILDRLCHASTYDAAKLSSAALLRFRHNDLDDLDRQLDRCEGARRRLVCIESVYSMDGDEAPLTAIAERCERRGALLLVDEAHALGIHGNGRGLCAELGVVPDLIVGTCSKTLGAMGGFLAGSSGLIELAVNRARSFIFSTAPVPAAMGAAVGMLDVLRKEPNLPAQILQRSADLRAALAEQGWAIPEGRGPIIPLIVGDDAQALALAAHLKEAGHFAPAIRPPTVPQGSSRVRITLTLAHTDADVRRMLKALAAYRAAQ
jgi:8-amino-7-oxononanoate synthase